MSTGEVVTRWSIRLALLMYVMAVGLLLRRKSEWHAIARVAWTSGCALYLCHVALAFGLYHGWSHKAAYEATRAESKQVVGVDWGGGLYVNYAFTALWLTDVIWWWWTGHRGYVGRSGLITAVVHGIFGLIAFNATVVFESGRLRLAGLAATATIFGMALCRLRSSARGEEEGTFPRARLPFEPPDS